MPSLTKHKSEHYLDEKHHELINQQKTDTITEEQSSLEWTQTTREFDRDDGEKKLEELGFPSQRAYNV